MIKPYKPHTSSIDDKLNEIILTLNDLAYSVEELETAVYLGPDDDLDCDGYCDDDEVSDAMDELTTPLTIGDAIETLRPLLPDDHLLLDFVRYCAENPELRMWQALRNWSGYSTIYGSGPDEDLIDTFYKTTKGPAEERVKPVEALKAFRDELEQYRAEQTKPKKKRAKKEAK